MANMRNKGKSTVVWALMALLLLGLGGFGVTNFAGNNATIAVVGDTKVTTQDYARALQIELNNMTQQTGQHFTLAQAQSMGIPQVVLSRLVTAAALEAEAVERGVSVGDRVVAEEIVSAPAFQGPTGFQRAVYTDLLRREGLTESEFEHDIRMDQARVILQRAVMTGIVPPQAMVDQAVGWLLETRDLRWLELTDKDLTSPVNTPDDETLRAWHQANSGDFTAPEIRQITYVWLTPDMLADQVRLDETALREIYEERADEFRQPERRMVERLVYPSVEAATEAKARLDRGEVSFEQLAAERGLTLADADMGEVTQSQLGEAGEAVFALDQPGVVGPVQVPLGPALFAMNAILDPIDIPFEQALPELRNEAAADRARRLIQDNSTQIEDLLAGGATLEDLAEETPMQMGRIDWSANSDSVPDEIGGYPAFRERAAAVAQQDFPELFELSDGGVFALRLDEIVPPALIPFEEVRDEVLADWRRAEIHRQLLALAETRKVDATAESMAPPPVRTDSTAAPTPANNRLADQASNAPATTNGAAAAPALEWQPEDGMLRDSVIAGVPPSVVASAFRAGEGKAQVVDADGRVFIVRVEAIHKAELTTDEAGMLVSAVRARQADSLQQDMFGYFTRALQQQFGTSIDQSAIAAVHAQMP